jgi:hypothetical protein
MIAESSRAWPEMSKREQDKQILTVLQECQDNPDTISGDSLALTPIQLEGLTLALTGLNALVGEITSANGIDFTRCRGGGSMVDRGSSQDWTEWERFFTKNLA